MLRLDPDQFNRIDARFHAGHARRIGRLAPEVAAAQKLADRQARAKEIARVLKQDGGIVSRHLPEPLLKAGMERSLENPSMWRKDDIGTQGMIGYMGLADMVARNGPWPETPGLEEAMQATVGGPVPDPTNPIIAGLANHFGGGMIGPDGQPNVQEILQNGIGGIMSASGGSISDMISGGLGGVIPPKLLSFPQDFEQVTDKIANAIDPDQVGSILDSLPPDASAMFGAFDSALSNPMAAQAFAALGLGKEAAAAQAALTQGKQVLGGLQALQSLKDPMSLLKNPLTDGVLSALGMDEELQKLAEIRKYADQMQTVMESFGSLKDSFPSSAPSAPSIVNCKTKPPPVSKPASGPPPGAGAAKDLSHSAGGPSASTEGSQSADNPYGPENNPYGPENKPYGPENKPYGPENKPYGPESKPYGPESKPYGPENKPYGPENKQYDPNEKFHDIVSKPARTGTETDRINIARNQELNPNSGVERKSIIERSFSNTIDLSDKLNPNSPQYDPDLYKFVDKKLNGGGENIGKMISIEKNDLYLGPDYYEIMEFTSINYDTDYVAGASYKLADLKLTRQFGSDINNPLFYYQYGGSGPNATVHADAELGSAQHGGQPGFKLSVGTYAALISGNLSVGTNIPDLSTWNNPRDEIEASFTFGGSLGAVGKSFKIDGTGPNEEKDEYRVMGSSKIGMLLFGVKGGVNLKVGEKD